MFKKLASLSVAAVAVVAAAPAFAAGTTPDVSTMLSGVDFSNAESGVIAAGGLIGGLIVVGTGVKWALRFLRA